MCLLTVKIKSGISLGQRHQKRTASFLLQQNAGEVCVYVCVYMCVCVCVCVCMCVCVYLIMLLLCLMHSQLNLQEALEEKGHELCDGRTVNCSQQCILIALNAFNAPSLQVVYSLYCF